MHVPFSKGTTAGPCTFRAQRMISAALVAAFLGTAGILLAPIGVAHGEVRFHTRTLTYPAPGTNALAILQSMRRNGPPAKGHRAFARTRMKFRWQGRYRQAGARCRVVRFDVQAHFDIQLPKATDFHRLSPVEQKEWRQFLGILKRHERTHARISRRCIIRAVKRLERLSAPTCAQLKRKVRKTFKQAMQSCRSAHDRLDRRDVPQTPKIPFVRRALRIKRALRS